MSARILLAVTLVALSGCAQIEGMFKSSATPPAPPPPPVASPSPPPSPPKSAAPPPQPPPASPSPPLRPELSAREEQRLIEDARQKIGEVERLLREVEGRSMKPPQQETLLAAKNFLDQARNAMGERDYERAVNLAKKARALSDDLAAGTK